MRSSRQSKCRSHGGASTGPRTKAGRQRIREANWRHGKRSSAAVDQASEIAARIRHLADALQVLWQAKVYDLRGRKPDAYRPLRTEADVHRFLSNLIKEGLGEAE
jgi:hypothetical protein